METIKVLSFLLLFLLMAACKEPEPVSPINIDEIDNPLEKKFNNISVMTRNIYVGTDVDMILQEEDPEQIPVKVAEAFQILLSTNFPERADALAKEIFDTRPHLIGLQEVSTFRLQSPGDAVYEGTEPAEEVFMDYLEILMNAISSYGLEYNVVAKVENHDVEMPMIVNMDPLEFDDVRVTDYNVILARKEIKISNVKAVNYETNVIMPENGLELPCGYTAVTARINGKKYRFVNTHLQDADQGGVLLQIQLAQAAELVNSLSNVNIPVILVGDFNSAAPNETAYEFITGNSKIKDTWLLNRSNSNIDGFTYGHDAGLRNSEQSFWKRIDYVFVRNGMHKNKFQCLQCVTAEVTGDEIGDKTSSGLWPSDHGGVFTKLKFNQIKRPRCMNIH